MATDPQLLNCNSGCQLDRMKFLYEQQFLDMNDMLNNLQTEHIELCNYLEGVLIPFLEYYADKDDEANYILREIYTYL